MRDKLINWFIVDAHSDYGLKIYNDYLNRISNSLKEHLNSLRAGFIRLEALTIGGDFDLFPNMNIREYKTIEYIIKCIISEIKVNSSETLLIKNEGNLKEILKSKKVGFILALEGAGPIGKNLSNLFKLRKLGLRSLMLTHNEKNQFADGCMVKKPKGLTKLGKILIEELNNLGIIIDVSHLSEPSFWDLLKTCEKPIIASHSNSKTICNHPRNLTDEQIEAIANTGGVIGINFFSKFLRQDFHKSSINDVLKHINYMIDLVGIDHVGLGPDFLDYCIEDLLKLNPQLSVSNKKQFFPEGLENVESMPRLVISLKESNFSNRDIEKILGLNFIRVYEKIIREN